MKSQLFIIALLAIILPGCCIFSDCEGCTDPSACNYDYDAKDDDGSCNYSCNQPIPPPPGGECSGNELQYYDVLAQANINVFDNQFGSPYQGQVISLLTIRQDRFQSCENGYWQLGGYAENIIFFKNITQHTVSFGYQIIQSAQTGQTKEYQNFVNQLPPGQTYQINTGTNTFFNVNVIPLYVNLSGILYQ